jgi:hypothetical protein
MDELMPDALVIHMNSNTPNNTEHDYNTMIGYINRASLHVKFCECSVVNFPLRFLIAFTSNIKIIGNKIYLKIPANLIFEAPIPVVKFNSTTHLSYSIENVNEISNFVTKFSIICKVSYYDQSRRNTFFQNNISYKMQNMTSIYVKNNNELLTDFQVDLTYISGLIKGFFIECNTDDLYEIKFNICGREKINYNSFYIQE